MNEQRRIYFYAGNTVNGRTIIDFSITLEPDGRYSWYETPISSFIGTGHYTINDNILTMNDDEGFGRAPVHRFRMNGDRLFFMERDSDNFHMVRLQDNAEFVLGVNPVAGWLN